VRAKPLTLNYSGLLAITYAFFVIFFPWDFVSRGGFSDFNVYIEYFDYFKNSGQSKDSMAEIFEFTSPIQYFLNEVAWFELVRTLNSITEDSETSLRIISFFILFVWGWILFHRVSYGVALLFLFNPFVIDVAMSGIRHGLAWSLFIIGLMSQSKWLKAVLFLTGMFVHSTTLVIVIFYILTKLSSRFISGKPLLLVGLGAGICVGLALTIFNELVLGTIGDRRSGADYVVGGDSFKQASIWAILLYFQCTSGSTYVKKNIFVIAVLAWYQIMNPFIPASYRIWAALLPVVALSVMNLAARKRQIFLYLYSGYLVFQYLYWTKLFYYWHTA
jgi:hypothetical protein